MNLSQVVKAHSTIFLLRAVKQKVPLLTFLTQRHSDHPGSRKFPYFLSQHAFATREPIHLFICITQKVPKQSGNRTQWRFHMSWYQNLLQSYCNQKYGSRIQTDKAIIESPEINLSIHHQMIFNRYQEKLFWLFGVPWDSIWILW